MILRANIRGSQVGAVRDEVFDGRPHLVVPVVAMVVGVHAGSGGAVFYSAEELAAFANAWDGEPVTLRHPIYENQPVSANIPEVLEQYCVGRVFHMTFSDGKLRGELWIDVAKAEEKMPQALDRLRSGAVMEVSTGLFADCDGLPGVWNGEEYIGRIRNIRPDHIALLPDEIGACSVADGCGVRANEKKSESHKKEKCGMTINWKSMRKNLMKVVANELSLDDISRQVFDFVNSLDSPEWINYVVEVLADSFIYEAVKRNVGPEGGSPARFMYQRSYTATEVDGVTKITVADDAKEVAERTEYVPVDSAAARANAEPEKKYPAPPVADKEITNATIANTRKENQMDRKAIIDGLISCPCINFAEADRASLETLSDDMLTKLEAQRIENKKLRDNATAQPPAISEEDKTALADFRANKADYDQFKTNRAKEKADLVAKLIENKVPFSKEELEGKDVSELQKLATLANVQTDPPVDYSGAAGGPRDNSGVRPMPSVWDKK